MASTPAESSPPAWTYGPAADLDESLVERLRRFPREPDMLVYGARALAAVALRAFLRGWHRLSVTGRENPPDDRPEPQNFSAANGISNARGLAGMYAPLAWLEGLAMGKAIAEVLAHLLHGVVQAVVDRDGDVVREREWRHLEACAVHEV